MPTALLIVVLIAANSSARAAAIIVSEPALYYVNIGPFPLPGDYAAPGQYIEYSADSVVPNGAMGTTGVATTTNTETGVTLTHRINFDPGPIQPNLFSGNLLLCTTTPATCTPSGNNNPANLTGPWTLTFSNPDYTSSSIELSPVGGEIPFPESVTLSGAAAAPTLSWIAPPGPTPDSSNADGYRITIFQNNIIAPGNAGTVVSKNLMTPTYTVNPADFPPAYPLKSDTTYTIELEDLVTRDGSKTNLSNGNISAASRVFSSFQILPADTPPVSLPTFTLVGGRVIYGFSLTVAPDVTYYIDPAVATGYIYQTGADNPNFASVELPDIGNPNPYDLYLWNGSAFVFDTTLAADTLFDFGPGGVSEFEVLGIDPSLGLDPDNTTAFITALTFESAGNFTGTMTPITTNAPEPASLALLASGLLGLGLIRRRRRP